MKIVSIFDKDDGTEKNNFIHPEILFENVIDSLNDLRESDCNKGTFGTLGCVCGSFGMAGAAMLCASAAMTCGSGIVKMFLPKSIYPIAASNLWEAVFAPFDDSENGTLRFCDIDKILDELNKCTAAVIGCGMKVTDDTERIVCEIMTKYEKPVVLDADGINCISKHIDILKQREYPTVLTPHPGEMARLLNSSVKAVQADRIKTAERFAKEYGCVLALKGVGTIISNGEFIAVNPTGNGCLAKGGSGDVLAGIIASLVCQGVDCFDAAVTGVYLHGYAANECIDEYSLSCVSARDVIQAIKYLMG